MEWTKPLVAPFHFEDLTPEETKRMFLKASIGEDMKAAMKAKDAQRLSAIRLLLAAIKQREVDERKELSDAEVVAVIEKMIKQRRDSITQFQAANRKDLVDGESSEEHTPERQSPQQLLYRLPL